MLVNVFSIVINFFDGEVNFVSFDSFGPVSYIIVIAVENKEQSFLYRW